MRNPKAYEGKFHGEQAIWLEAGDYEAVLLPQLGGNLVAYRDRVQGYRFLHEPKAEEMDHLRAKPTHYGIPVLFPPNRFADGQFTWEGKTYRFPINEPNRNNRLHGFVHNRPWEVEFYHANEIESQVIVSLTVDEHDEMYTYFPHCFTIRLRYTLSQDGLQQQVTVKNNGPERMPCLIGFHTAINAPFTPHGAASDYRMNITIGERWEMNERMLPTGSFQSLTEEELRMRASSESKGIDPFSEPMDNHYTAVSLDGRNRMELYDLRENVKLIYDAGTAYKQWMIWNNFATEGFFCPEPQVNTVNAPNMSLPAEQMGLIGLDSGEIWEETSRIYCVQVK